MGIGNCLNRIVNASRYQLFTQGQIAQLTYGAFNFAAETVRADTEDSFTFQYPIGLLPDRQPMHTQLTYQKEELLKYYEDLAHRLLPLNCIVQMVTIVDALLSDIVREVVRKFPKKLGGKKTMPLEQILQAKSLEEIHLRVADNLINELSYLSPDGFAEQMKEFLSINLRECVAFHRYLEVKATRDIMIHNKGVANDIYVRKSGTHARFVSGQPIFIDTTYFFESYEACLQLTEWLETELHQIWHSSEYELRKEQRLVALQDLGQHAPATTQLPKPPSTENTQTTDQKGKKGARSQKKEAAA